jgi:hypothetical protein
MLLWRPLFRRPLRMAIAARAAMTARACNLPPAAGLPGSGAAFQMKLLSDQTCA